MRAMFWTSAHASGRGVCVFMADSIRSASPDAHANLLGIGKAKPAKAHVNAIDMQWNEAIGQAISRAIGKAHLTPKVAAAAIGIDPSELSCWTAGTRRPHFDRLLATPELRRPVLTEMVKLIGGRLVERIEFPDVEPL